MPHHRQVSVFGLGHDELRSRREVDDALFALSHRELYAAEQHQRGQTAVGPFGRRCWRGRSPALVDVDVVDFVGADGDLGQRLDDVVALQDHVALLFVVVAGHVQDKQAVAERADRDTCGTTQQVKNTLVPSANRASVHLSERRNRCAA